MKDSPLQFAAGLLASAGLLGLALAPEWARPEALEALRDRSLNRADTERMERGYYETLLDAGRRLDSPLGDGENPAPTPAPAEPSFEAGPLALPTSDVREFVLRPNLAETLRGGRWTTNSLGLRDREYAVPKPPGTVRVAMLGDSIGVGWGVDDGRGFEPLVEAALDARSRSSGGPAVEILNFSVPGHAPGQRWEHFARSAWPTAPDLALYQATPADPGWDTRRLRGLLPRGIGWDCPQYRDVLAQTRLPRGRDFEFYRRALRPIAWALLGEVYRTVVSECHARGVPAAWVLVPRVGKPIDPGERARLVELARLSGFDAVIDLTDAYDGLGPAELAIAPNDYHPNAEGHARLARGLEAALAARPELLRIRAAGPPGDGR